jgi:hypothetical protein
MYAIEYEPRIQDPVIIARFEMMHEAERYLEKIRMKSPKAADHHKIIEISEDFHNPCPS